MNELTLSTTTMKPLTNPTRKPTPRLTMIAGHTPQWRLTWRITATIPTRFALVPTDRSNWLQTIGISSAIAIRPAVAWVDAMTCAVAMWKN